MRKYIVPGILVVYAAALMFLYFHCQPGVKPIYYQTFPQITSQQPQERIIETQGDDYSTNFVVGNKLQFTPVPTVSHTLLGADIGQVWYDATNSALRFIDGNTSGVQFAMGQFGSDIIYIRTVANDTVYFPELFDNYAFNVDYIMSVDTVNSADATITLEETYHADSTYTSQSSSVFPFTLSETSGITFLANSIMKYNRAVVAIGTADTIAIRIEKRPRIGQ